VERKRHVEKQTVPQINTTFENRQWFALYVMPRSEKKVTEKLLQKGVVAYIPLADSIRIWSDRKKKIKLPLISGIVFIHSTQNELSLALSTPGVVNVIRYMGKPALIRDYEIENLKIITQQHDGYAFLEDKHFDEGETVLVVQGSFYGLLAHYVRAQGKHRVVVELKALNRYIEVNVPVSFLEKMNKKVA
jgi:transcription antitermination factor NusG